MGLFESWRELAALIVRMHVNEHVCTLTSACALPHSACTGAASTSAHTITQHVRTTTQRITRHTSGYVRAAFLPLFPSHFAVGCSVARGLCRELIAESPLRLRTVGVGLVTISSAATVQKRILSASIAGFVRGDARAFILGFPEGEPQSHAHSACFDKRATGARLSGQSRRDCTPRVCASTHV